MKAIVDTSIWSLVLRRKQPEAILANILQDLIAEDRLASILQDLIADGRVIMIGAIRQEILSGIKHQQQYEKLKDNLHAFPDLLLNAEDYELAANYFNIYCRQGIQGSNTDFLICAIANRRNYEIFTTDNDFVNFSQYLPIVLTKL